MERRGINEREIHFRVAIEVGCLHTEQLDRTSVLVGRVTYRQGSRKGSVAIVQQGCDRGRCLCISGSNEVHLRHEVQFSVAIQIDKAERENPAFPRKVRGTADPSTARRDRSASPDFLSRVAASVNCMWFSLGRTT